MADFELSINPGSVKLPFIGITVSESIVVSWIIIIAIMILAVVVRLCCFRKSAMIPKGLTNIVELLVDMLDRFAQSNLGHMADMLSPYTFSLAIYIFMSGFIELFGLRSPLADLNGTLALAMLSFLLIHLFGLRANGLWGRIKQMCKPNVIMLPIKLVTEVAVPVSLACRLYGNMLGGLIVMELIYAVVPYVIPAFLSIYFTLFHAAIQAYIFMMLTMVFIREAAE